MHLAASTAKCNNIQVLGDVCLYVPESAHTFNFNLNTTMGSLCVGNDRGFSEFVC